MVNNTNDNDTFLFTPSCIKNGIVKKLEYINWEAGNSKLVPSQKAQVSWGKYKRK